MKKILGEAKSLRALLGGRKFAIDYYQREYRWKKKQVSEMIDDLAEKFGNSYDASHERTEVENYGHYFLVSIIISNKQGQEFIIDGQQRLTTLTLLLIHVYKLLENDGHKTQIANLIFSMKHGRLSFNIDVDERAACMEALFKGSPFEEARQPESVANVIFRSQDITELFPNELQAKRFPTSRTG